MSINLAQELLIYKHETIIKKASGAFGKKYALVHVPECDEVAGSGTRHIKECWRVVYMFDGNRHSKAFSTLEQAEKEIDQWTVPIIGIPVTK